MISKSGFAMSRPFELWTAIGLWVLLTLVEAKEVTKEFKVVPNSPGKVTVDLDTPPIPASSCTFEWNSNGATPEQWLVKVSGNPRSGDLECDIARRGNAATYLFFVTFRVTLGTSPVLEAVVHDNDGALDGKEHFETEGECVQNGQNWPGGTIKRISLKSMVVS
jgi:UPF0556 domain